MSSLATAALDLDAGFAAVFGDRRSGRLPDTGRYREAEEWIRSALNTNQRRRKRVRVGLQAAIKQMEGNPDRTPQPCITVLARKDGFYETTRETVQAALIPGITHWRKLAGVVAGDTYEADRDPPGQWSNRPQRTFSCTGQGNITEAFCQLLAHLTSQEA